MRVFAEYKDERRAFSKYEDEISAEKELIIIPT